MFRRLIYGAGIAIVLATVAIAVVEEIGASRRPNFRVASSGNEGTKYWAMVANDGGDGIAVVRFGVMTGIRLDGTSGETIHGDSRTTHIAGGATERVEFEFDARAATNHPFVTFSFSTDPAEP